jgi:hypothetical protein
MPSSLPVTITPPTFEAAYARALRLYQERCDPDVPFDSADATAVEHSAKLALAQAAQRRAEATS